ncbi:hypothetical protein MHBO_003365 [Bonamia ostreae]|uniref:SNARE protein n=1 Tax=Bonamia ostreae TaxID=126728 RepID=A0ABV2AQ79_9EUKA
MAEKIQILYLGIFHKNAAEKPIKLGSVEELSSFGWLQRRSVREHLLFISRLLIENIGFEERQKIAMKDFPFLAHVFVQNNGLSGILVTNNQYPERVAFEVINKALLFFEEETFKNDNKDKTDFKTFSTDQQLKTELLQELMDRFQKPEEADKLLLLGTELEKIENIMNNNIDNLLGLGRNLDDLIKDSEDLSMMSKMFAQNAKKNNQCCRLY